MAAEEFKRRLTAILCSDVEGYSLLMREDEQATVPALHRGMETYFTFYSSERPHQSLGYRTPAEVHYAH